MQDQQQEAEEVPIRSDVKPHTCDLKGRPPNRKYNLGSTNQHHTSPTDLHSTAKVIGKKGHSKRLSSAKKTTSSEDPPLVKKINMFIQGFSIGDTSKWDTNHSRLQKLRRKEQPIKHDSYVELQYREKKIEYFNRFGSNSEIVPENRHRAGIARPFIRKVMKPKPSNSDYIFGSSVDRDNNFTVMYESIPQEMSPEWDFYVTGDALSDDVYCNTKPTSSTTLLNEAQSIGPLTKITKAISNLPKLCHHCGMRYPIMSAKFCCECGCQRIGVT